jgi:hypothetical protein
MRSDDSLRFLTSIVDPGGKVRLIAIFDYWSQAALRELHLYIINSLSTWFKSCDKTKDQQSYRLRLSELQGQMKYSFDLTAATDRFPIELQVFV